MSIITSICNAILSLLATLRLYVKPSTPEGQIEKDQQNNASAAQNAQDGRP